MKDGFSFAIGTVAAVLILLIGASLGVVGIIIAIPFLLFALFLVVGSFFEWPPEGGT